MAPFNTHFLIAEKIWPNLDGPWQPYYGQFCFGCIAPDVDKVSAVLTQKDTHFFDRTGPYELMASHRSATFIQQQADFLSGPFAELCPQAQAFVLGYLCHLCVDEVSKYMWGYHTWMQFRDIGPGPSFAALDELARRQIKNYAAQAQALNSVAVLDVIPRIPPADLEATLQGVRNFVNAPTTEEEFLALVEMFEHPTPAERQQKLQKFRATINIARRRVHIFKLDTLVQAGLARSRRRLNALVAGHVPEPDVPELEADQI